MQKYIKITIGLIAVISYLSACKSQEDNNDSDTSLPVTPVKVIHPVDSALSEYIELSAVSAYLEKSFVKANINGYVERTMAKTGQQVGKGQLLFSLITKEARSIGNTVNKLDPGFKFSGVSNIRSGQAGTIVQVSHQIGDYVQDGEALATVSSRNSLVFLLDLPYELNQIIDQNKSVEVDLPDGTKLSGLIFGTMPLMDSLAQTQRYIIKVVSNKDIPSGLIAKVRLVKSNHPHAQVFPTSAVLTNETEDEFWVMKMINDSTAIRVNVKRGIVGNTATEILSPKFMQSDRIILTGNYGIADTAKVQIQK